MNSYLQTCRGANKRASLKLEDTFDLRNVVVREEPVEEEDCPPNSFTLLSKYGRPLLIICCPTAEDKDSWLNDFKEAKAKIMEEEQKFSEEAMAKSISKAELVKQLFTSQYEMGGKSSTS